MSKNRTRGFALWLAGALWFSALAGEETGWTRDADADVSAALVKAQGGPIGAALIEEGFEGGVMPPAGWARDIQNPDYTWELASGGAHAGTYSAWVDWEPDPYVPQNEWLISPAFSASEASVSFWSKGSTYWCRSPYNGCELSVWLVVGEVGGGDDITGGNADGDWTASHVWSRSTFDLTPLLPSSGPVRLAFNYIGWSDRDAVGLDDIVLTGETGSWMIFSDGFESGDLTSWSGPVP